ncbi:uncharacterized protein [Spinacia oleracea]|uniref:Uncharacterized protein isoform X1 n=1 Tax=Spinacia oleracea TaxID=3562 RepID=A0ABM3QTP1_SPIOL|nr:uncharacterized protein LOC110800743 isoform X1 [Spinacia oleracea]XP_056686733.1 uncharacterized protein LOC110800743 isoform X1 [Spinacia oleracea]XP_056686734.1 uncharacterized protein LOC110800743 isoform X1 [Spinacia oleracea]
MREKMMEKSGGDERRVMSRQSGPNKKKTHHHLLVFSGIEEKEESRREKVKQLSIGEREMDFDAQDELLHSTTVSSIKFKLPRKIFSDYNTSVPRKLRSAIRKRSCESASVVSPDAKRSSNSLKKSKICMQNGWSEPFLKGAVSVGISKEEEEVAETLFALAGMIPHVGVDVNHKDYVSLEAKSSDLPKKQHSDPMPSSEDPLILKEKPDASTTEGSPRDSSQATAVDDSAPFIWSKLSERRQMNPNLKVSVPPTQFQTPQLLRACADRQFTHSTSYGSTEQNRERGLSEIKPQKSQFPKRESHINIGVTDLEASQGREYATSIECRDNALASRPLHGSGVDGLSLESSAPIIPSWLNFTSSSKLVSCKDTSSAGKVPWSINGGRKSWKRCLAHVYISRMIQVLQASEEVDIKPLNASKSRPSQYRSAGPVTGKQEDLNVILASGQGGHMFCSTADKNICGTENDATVPLKNGQVEEDCSLSGNCDSKKQSYNFLSLSTGAGTYVNNGVSVNRLGMNMKAKDHVLQLHEVAQRNTYVSCSMPQNSFPLSRYQDQVTSVSVAPPSMPPQVHIQVPPYFSNGCGPVPLGTTRSTQQAYPKQQQQQQQQIWTTQLAAQFRPGLLRSSHIANWQNIARDPHSMNQMQAPRSSLETIGSKYIHISQQSQQQLLGLCPSLPTSNAKNQNSQLPSTREDKEGRFHPDGVLPLKLLCNERLLT